VTAIDVQAWTDANQRHLAAALALLAAVLDEVDDSTARAALDAAAAAMPAPAAVDRLTEAFALSPFERDLLVLCAGPQLDARIDARVRELGHPAPTFALALATLAQPHWSAISPAAPLRRWRLISVANADAPVTSPLHVDERVLHFLTGTGYVDERLEGLLVPAVVEDELPPSQDAVAQRLADLWSATDRPSPVVALAGSEPQSRRAVAAAACAELALALHVLPAAEVPANAGERASLARLLEREAVLGGSALAIEVDSADDAHTRRAAVALAERLRGLVALSAHEPLRAGARPVALLDVAKPTAAEQRALWHASLPAADGSLDAIVAQFDLDARDIRRAAADALASGDHDPEALSRRAWRACRRHGRPALDDLAQRIVPAVGWDDIVVPAPQRSTLHEIVAHVRYRDQVHRGWGFADRGVRGLGIGALFHGPSGTGKTLAAEVLAAELELDLYRIDLSQVVSKYIGETEKNLRRVFDAAESGGVVLLFDEADALFGKRSEVKDSHDRYANIEVSYLLQRMEAYRGLAILTTNHKAALDPAFLRRLRFVVAFPFPDGAQRAEIWRCAFPAATPTAELDVSALARLHVSGGSIRNIALGAAFRAADAHGAVTMEQIRLAARSEYAKIERPLSEAELGGMA
jgi:hypothetical protein